MDINLDLESTRRDLIARREAHGADTPLGYRCSNLIEQIQNYRNETDKDARTHLAGNIGRTVTDIRQLLSGPQ